MMPVAGHRQNAKTCANMSAGREGTRLTRPSEGKIKGREVRPGWWTVGASALASVFIVAPRCEPQLCSPHTRQFRNPFNENYTSRDILAMTSEDDFRIRPGRIRSRQLRIQNRSWPRRSPPPKRQAVMSAAKGGPARRAHHVWAWPRRERASDSAPHQPPAAAIIKTRVVRQTLAARCSAASRLSAA